MKKASAAGIHDLIDCFERNTQILDQLGETTSGWGAMLTHLMVSKLSETIQVQWEEHVSQKDEPSFKMLVTFLKTQTRILDAVFVDQRIFSTSVTSSAVGSKSHPTKLSVNSATETSGPNCIACSEQHFLSRCPSFNKLPVDKRLQLTNSKRLCSNCLGRNHLARDCPSKYRCRTCSKKHHTLLHPGFPGSGSTATSTSSQDDNSASPSTSGVTPNSGGMVSSSVATISSNMAMGGSKSHVFLLTAVLEVKDYCGRIHHARALLDSGSQANLMSERLCQLLKLPRRNKKVEIVGIGQARRQTAYEVSTNIASRIRDFSILMDFLVLGQVTDNQPSTSLPLETWKPPQDMVLADPGFYASGPIDLVLGSQFFYDFHLLHGGRLQIRKINDDLPVFVNTVFGWVAAGEANLGGNFGRVSCNLALADPLDKAIEKFWTIEELSEKPQRSQEEKDCEAHFQHTITRDDTGRYMARYPKRAGFYEMIGDSKETARRRFLQIERRLGKDANLRKHYNAFMQEYIDLGHMKAVGMVDEIPKTEKTVCYLPHHPVFKESSSTTKVRVVFDGSAKTSSNYSLNEILLTGPVIQDDLFDLMLRFRKNAVALVSDVEKMHRQIRIHQEDTPLQRILWRFDPRDPVQIYELQTVTYGLAPSSFLATRVLQQLSMDYQAKYSKGSLAVSEDFYMDDLLSGADTVENARKLRDEVQALLSEGGFQLRKWSSNRSELLQDLPSEVLGVADTLRFEPEQKIKTLGVVWDPQLDQLCIEVQPIEADTQWTKRKIFSAIAKLYDPLGFVSPVVAWAKMRLQHLWLASIGWDDPVLPEIESKWTEFYSQLPLLQSFRVTRFIWLPDTSTVQFHVFCDASEVGYGACIYARSISLEGHVKVELIASKSRVAPLKRISLPRLELCSALLAAKLYSKISAALRMEDAFLAALRRFIARRGMPAEVHSDNGTNFQGAKNKITELYSILNSKRNQEIIANECTNRGIIWRFIPPKAPNFGGLWEAAVKTAKSSLIKTIGNTKLSFEDFTTILTQIEANMNTRPLTPLSEDPTELDVLTPGHFLTGTSLRCLPDPDYSNVPTNRLRHYQLLQSLIQHHWTRWRKEYLTELNNQRKSTTSPVDIGVGQIVLLLDENKPSNLWPLAKVEKISPGDDDVVRVVTIRTKSGVYTRPASKVCPLLFNREISTITV
ncbi:uncharacterized protein LOC131433967 [Malaya genurostris]|uniref:uncharacterized protein LOC131433967 n=1 Tax=Malaya genurostris TaxID=325434 RepID=UPI0026F39910|nr:uncharacterized protein LOC131433967 [Malaya genurostris]